MMMSNPDVRRLLLPLLFLLPAAALWTTAAHPAGIYCFIQVQASSARPRHRLSASSAPAPEAANFHRWFRGQFDNAAQVAEERAQGMGPGEGGGHEQIHCVLEPLPALCPGSLGGGEGFLGACVRAYARASWDPEMLAHT